MNDVVDWLVAFWLDEPVVAGAIFMHAIVTPVGYVMGGLFLGLAYARPGTVWGGIRRVIRALAVVAMAYSTVVFCWALTGDSVFGLPMPPDALRTPVWWAALVLGGYPFAAACALVWHFRPRPEFGRRCRERGFLVTRDTAEPDAHETVPTLNGGSL